MAEEIKDPVAPTEPKDKKEEVPSQNSIKEALEKETAKQTYSEKEKVAFNLKKKADEAKSLGLDPKLILGVDEEPKDEIPEWYRREKAKETQQTAVQLADRIEDADERNLVKTYLQNRIVPSGNPEDDFRLALNAVSALKNKQIAEEVSRKVFPKTTASGGSAPIKSDEGGEFVPTQEEADIMKHFHVSKEKILESRRKEAEKRK